MRAAGSQGVQNGSISCVALVLAVPGGTREVLAENVLAAWLDLEVASGNDAISSHSAIRKTAKLMGQFLPGTDFVTSGYSAMPRYDNMFGGGNYDSDDLDEWLTIQRDWQVDAGIEPLDEAQALAVRERGARAVQAVFDAFGFPPISEEEVRLATTCLDSRDLPDRDRAADVVAADRVLVEGLSALDVARALDERGFPEVAAAVFEMQRQRVAADYLQTSAIIAADGTVVSAVNDPNDYPGPAPATGWRASGGSGCSSCRTRSTPVCSARRRERAAAVEELVRRLAGRQAGRGRGRRRARLRQRPERDDRRPLPPGRARGAHGRRPRRGRAAEDRPRSAAPPTSPSSATTARSSPAPASPSASSRRARR